MSTTMSAVHLVFITELDAVKDAEEPEELSRLRVRLASARDALMEKIASPEPTPYGAVFSLDDLFWALSFAWADVQDYVEEANSKLINEERGFAHPELFCVKKAADGSFVPDRPRRHFFQTLADHDSWLGVESEDYPVCAWDDDDYAAATSYE
jgi:hypothetical protein